MINNHRYFRRNGILTTKGYYPLSLGSVKRTIILNQNELIYRFQTLLVQNCNLNDDNYHQELPFQPLKDKDTNNLKKWYQSKIDNIQQQYGNNDSQILVNQWKDILNLLINELNLKNLINQYIGLLNLLDSFGFNFINSKKIGNFSILEHNQQLVLIGHIDSSDDIPNQIDLARLNDQEFLKLVCSVNMNNRHSQRNPTSYEYFAIQIGWLYPFWY